MVPDSAIEQVSQSSESGVLCRGESCLPFVKSAQLFSAMKCMQLEQSRSACIWRSPGPNQPFCFGPRSVGQEYRKRSSGGRCVSAPWGGSWAGGPTPRLTSSSVSLLSCSSRASPPSPCGTLLSRALGFLTARWSQGSSTSPVADGVPDAGSGGRQKIKGSAWDLDSVTSAIFCYSKQSLGPLRLEIHTPSLVEQEWGEGRGDGVCVWQGCLA